MSLLNNRVIQHFLFVVLFNRKLYHYKYDSVSSVANFIYL